MAETLTERDLRAMHGLIEDARRDEPTSGLPWTILDGLAALVSCDSVSFPDADLLRGRQFLCQQVEDGHRLLLEGPVADWLSPDHWRCIREFLPCSYPTRSGDLVSILRWSDFYSERQLRSTPLITDYFGPGRWHAMHIAFPCAPGHMRKISFWRSGPDFSERDRMVAQLLRPHLWEIHVESQRRRHDRPHLSRREWEVLQLADQGYSNAEVAKLLHISVATVRKHMEHIFDRTGTRNRSSAAALMMSRRHSEPTPPPT